MVKKKGHKLQSLYLHCLDIDYFQVICPKGHIIYNDFPPDMQLSHPIRSFSCPRCGLYHSSEKVELKPVRSPKQKELAGIPTGPRRLSIRSGALSRTVEVLRQVYPTPAQNWSIDPDTQLPTPGDPLF